MFFTKSRQCNGVVAAVGVKNASRYYCSRSGFQSTQHRPLFSPFSKMAFSIVNHVSSDCKSSSRNYLDFAWQILASDSIPVPIAFLRSSSRGCNTHQGTSDRLSFVRRTATYFRSRFCKWLRNLFCRLKLLQIFRPRRPGKNDHSRLRAHDAFWP